MEEQRFEDYKESHVDRHGMEAAALILARDVIESRLQNLNQLREEVLHDRAEYVRNDVWEQKVSALDDRMLMLERTATTVEGAKARDDRIVALENFRGRAVGVLLVIVPVAGVIGAAVVKAFGG